MESGWMKVSATAARKGEQGDSWELWQIREEMTVLSLGVLVYVLMRRCINLCAYECGGWRPMSSVFFNSSPSHFLRQETLTKSWARMFVLTDWAHIPGILLVLLASTGITCLYPNSCLAFFSMHARDWSQFLMRVCQTLGPLSISSVPILSCDVSENNFSLIFFIVLQFPTFVLWSFSPFSLSSLSLTVESHFSASPCPPLKASFSV